MEKGTAFGEWYGEGRILEHGFGNVIRSNTTSTRPLLPSAEDCAFMYRYASGYLRSKNDEHYEISSYAHVNATNNSPHRSNHRSKHNQIYWETKGQWYAVGLGATSNLNGMRFARPRVLSDYITWAQELNKEYRKYSGDEGVIFSPPWKFSNAEVPSDDDDDDELLDIIMTRLRTSEGLDLDWIANHNSYNESCVDAILRGFELAIELGLGMRVTVPGKKYGIIRLSEPNGFLFSNNIISNIFAEID